MADRVELKVTASTLPAPRVVVALATSVDVSARPDTVYEFPAGTGLGAMLALTLALIGVSPAGADRWQSVVPVGVLAAPAGPAVATRPTAPTMPEAAIARAPPNAAIRVDSERAALIYVAPDVL